MFIKNWILIQLRTVKNFYRQNKAEFLARALSQAFFFVFGWWMLVRFLIWMFDFVSQRSLPAQDFAFILLSFCLLIFLPLIFYSAIITLLTYLFQKDEIHFYFSLPVKKIAVFWLKFFQSYFATAWMIFLAFAAFLFSLQSYFKVSRWIYLTGSIGFLIYILIPLALAAIIVILISRFLPFIRAKGVLTVIGLFVGSLLVASIRVMQPEQLTTAEGKLRLVTFLETLHKPWMTLLPSEWVTNLVYAQKDFGAVFYNFFFLFGLAAALLIVLHYLAKAYYHAAWAKAETAGPAFEKSFRWEALINLFPPASRPVIKKDLLNFYRDTVEKGSLLILLPLVFVYLFSMSVLGRQMHTYNVKALFSYFFLYIFNFFYSSVVIAGLAGRWVLPSVSMEAQNFRLIKSSLYPLRDFFRAKFLLGFAPIFVFGELLIISSSMLLGFNLGLLLISVIMMALISWGMTMVPLILGIRYADFSISDSVEFILSLKGFFCFIWEALFMVLMVILIGIPSALFLRFGFTSRFLIPAALCGAITLGLVLFLSFGYYNSCKKLAARES